MAEGDTFAISALVRKRAELAGEIEAARARLDKTGADLASVDNVLRLLDPEIRLEAIRPKAPRPAVDPSRPVITTRMVLEVLRDAEARLTIPQIANRVLDRLGLDAGDGKLLRGAGERVGEALRRQRRRGVARSAQEPGQSTLWELSPRG